MKWYFLIRKFINRLIPIRNNRVYICPHNNGMRDKYDILNYSSDNALTLLNAIKNDERFLGKVFYIECYSKNRVEQISNEISKWMINVKLVLSETLIEEDCKNNIRKWKNRLLRYSCKTWLSCTPHAGYDDKIKKQSYFCLSYSTPLKSDLSTTTDWNMDFIDLFLETSLMTASIHAAQYKNNIKRCPLLGFPRNDNLINSPRRKMIWQWMEQKGFDLKKEKIIVYAPTYREYENSYYGRNILGYFDDENRLQEFLEKNNLLLIVKFHPLQDCSGFTFRDRIINYEKNYDFSLYDVLAESVALISDYSSIIHDYLITNKPVIIDCFDYEKYDDTRGFAFDPLEIVCPGPVCRDFDEFENTLINELHTNKRTEKYYWVQSMFHKYKDGYSTSRVAELFWDLLNIDE